MWCLIDTMTQRQNSSINGNIEKVLSRCKKEQLLTCADYFYHYLYNNEKGYFRNNDDVAVSDDRTENKEL